MKRSDVVEIIAAWGRPEIFMDVYGGRTEEWADNLLYTLEHELGMLPPEHAFTSGERSGHYLNEWEGE